MSLIEFLISLNVIFFGLSLIWRIHADIISNRVACKFLEDKLNGYKLYKLDQRVSLALNRLGLMNKYNLNSDDKDLLDTAMEHLRCGQRDAE